MKGRKADVILAAYNAAEIAVRMMKDKIQGQDIATAIDKTCNQYKCKPLENMLMYCISQVRAFHVYMYFHVFALLCNRLHVLW